MLKFSIFKFPVQVHPLFWLTCFLIGGGIYAETPLQWAGVAVWIAVVFVSIMVHELGHAVAGRMFGAQPAIALHGLGGLTYFGGGHFSRPQNIIVSLAGPLAGFSLGTAALAAVILLNQLTGVRLEEPLAIITFNNLLWVNFGWSIFNLLPVLPMDGGQVLRDVLGPRRIGFTRMIGGITSVALAALAASQGFWIMAVLLGFFAYGNFRGGQKIPGGTVGGR